MASPSSIPFDLSQAMIPAPPGIAEWLTVLPVVTMIAAGALLMMVRKSVRLHGAIAIAALVLLVLIDAALLWHVWENGPVTMTMGRWLPPFGISFTADLFGAVMALAAAIVALMAAIFSLQDIDGRNRRYGFFPFLMLLMAGVSGAFLTGDIFNLYVWFEVLLISSFGLLILGSEPRQIEGALKYAILNLIATTLFLIAVGYLYAIFGTLNMADIARKATALRGVTPDAPPLVTLTTLFILAFGMKAAAFPVNFWLPASYHTPRISVSALFGGLLTKVGIYALIRVTIMLLPVERDALSLVIGVSAVLTMILGGLGALAQNDLRRLIGYVVITGIGTMLAGVAVGTPAAVSGAIFYALHSLVAMTALYLMAGEAARLAGSWQLSSLGGLWSRAPWFSAASFVLVLAAAGLPPMSGLWPKVTLLKASLDIGAWWLAAAILVSALLVTIALARVFLLAYWRPAVVPDPSAEASAPGVAGLDGGASAAADDWRTALPILALAAILLMAGLFPEPLLRISQAAAEGLADPRAYIGSVFPGGLSP
jgi:multicomponent Na+:H+ antiporter subunit D